MMIFLKNFLIQYIVLGVYLVHFSLSTLTANETPVIPALQYPIPTIGVSCRHP